MQNLNLGVSSLTSSRLAYGCWRLAGTWNPSEVTPEASAVGRLAVITAYEAGYLLFDTADIYCRGESERILGKVIKEISGMRQRIVLATKGGIRPAGDPDPGAPGRYDFSADYLTQACEQSLKRLGVETIDLYMLHRPDLLADPQEVARAFSKLRDSGKVRYFGVSNFKPTFLTALQVACPMPLVVHQVEISLAKLDSLTDGTLDQCLIENITPMAWSPLAGGLIGGGARQLLPSQEVYRPDSFLETVDAIARELGVSRTTIALAWLLRHPAKILPIVGSTNPKRIKECPQACEVQLSRENWYRLLIAARGEPMP